MVTILFDIDYTLLDTDKLKNTLHKKRLPRILEITPSALEKHTQSYLQTLNNTIEFSPRKYIQFLNDKLNLTEQVTTSALDLFLDNEPDFKLFLYPGTKTTLKELSLNNELGVFSEGDPEFQKAKIEQCQIDHFFNPDLIFIFPEKKETFGKVWQIIGDYPQPIYIIDDNINHIKEISKSKFKPILIDRKENYNGQLESISDLQKLTQHIK